MKITNIVHEYEVRGTAREVAFLKFKLLEKYETVDVYPTPYDFRLVCKMGDCVRCIESHTDEDGTEHEGEYKPAECEECKVCRDCEHLEECSKSN